MFSSDKITNILTKDNFNIAAGNETKTVKL
jgi:hypothetical protein